jgi:hypothetical protein
LRRLSIDNIHYFNRLDFILIEDLDHAKNADVFVRLKIELGNLNCKKGLAHCDLLRACSNLNCSLDVLLSQMKETGLFWEINSASRYSFFDDIIEYNRYNTQEIKRLFEMLNQHQVQAAVGSDCHSIGEYEYGRLSQANHMVNEYMIPCEF